MTKAGSASRRTEVGSGSGGEQPSEGSRLGWLRPGGGFFADGLLPEGATGARAHPAFRLFVRLLRRPLLPAIRLWRRNIKLRVVASTLLISLVVVVLLGVVVTGQVRNGLLETKQQLAQSQAAGGFDFAQQAADTSTLRGHSSGDADGSLRKGSSQSAGTWLNNLVEQLASGGQGVYSVVALSSESEGAIGLGGSDGRLKGARVSGDVLPEESIPDDLREKLDEQSGTHQRYATLHRQNGDTESALIVGKRVSDPNGNPYQLYYAFPFGQEMETLALLKGTLITAGIFVVVLFGVIGWLVVRQVVSPVRMAAGISERLAAGRLQERMKVSGEDDIARLGESFNKMAATLQLKIQQLEGLSRMQRRFVSDVSHELRTPLTTVRMAADVIHAGKDDFDSTTARSAELLIGQLDRFESLLGDLLEISRFDAGAAALEAAPTDVRDLVRRVVDGCAPLTERTGSRVLIKGDETPLMAEIDSRRIERVLRNLVDNAIEHGEGKDIVIRLAAGAGVVAVAVRDYGVGLKPAEANRVFNRFWRADPARARTTGGSGLGLSIATEDARLHGGWLQVWGEPGGGTQFRLTLPTVGGEPLRGSPIPLEPADSRRRRDAEGALPTRTRVAQDGTSDAGEVAGGGPDVPGPDGAVSDAAGPSPVGSSPVGSRVVQRRGRDVGARGEDDG
ncbi:MtrAB system histidine kinase MtrB [Streptomyces oceani]|uniref:MtrAB system histidine kinase MtrB n=1 Tax=Streptomyces oceani TaxID=1075402 RepID=UPI0009A0BB89|nr:MtrAB system histidine kinase MtrB [Streptomyces oceani]